MTDIDDLRRRLAVVCKWKRSFDMWLPPDHGEDSPQRYFHPPELRDLIRPALEAMSEEQKATVAASIVADSANNKTVTVDAWHPWELMAWCGLTAEDETVARVILEAVGHV